MPSGDGKSIKVWDTSTGEETLTIQGNPNFVIVVSWSPDGTRLAAAGENGTIQIYDASHGYKLEGLTGPPIVPRPVVALKKAVGP